MRGEARQGRDAGAPGRVETSPAAAPASPLDPGYQTLEHSYDGESSLSSEAAPAGPACWLLALPDSCLLSILARLDSAVAVGRAGLTCRRLQQLAWRPLLWSSIRLTGCDRLDTDRAVRAILARLVGTGRGAPSVTAVQLGGNSRLTDRSLAVLGRNCPGLVRLELQRCRAVTNGGILDLVTRCPQLAVLDLTGQSLAGMAAVKSDTTVNPD